MRDKKKNSEETPIMEADTGDEKAEKGAASHSQIRSRSTSSMLSYGATWNSNTDQRRQSDSTLLKDGRQNFRPTNMNLVKRHLISDIFITLLETRWRWTIVTICISVFGSWILFAVAWWLMVFYHGDTDPLNANDPDWKPCITGIKSFTSSFLFSLETQQTTGYGFYHLTDECPHAITLLCVQSIFGVVLEGIVVGLVLIKISRAKKRSETIRFTHNAVISTRDGIKYFMFRIADLRTSNLLQAKVRAQLIQRRVTAEGEVIPFAQTELKVHGEGEDENGGILLLWPTLIVHKLDESSPLKFIKPTDLTPDNTTFEIIVIMEGVVETTGHTTQARTSYLPHEILWGQRFQTIQSTKTNGERIIDYSLLDSTTVVLPQISSTVETEA